MKNREESIPGSGLTLAPFLLLLGISVAPFIGWGGLLNEMFLPPPLRHPPRRAGSHPRERETRQWCFVTGQFQNVEEPKYEMLRREEEYERRGE
jgi:hypothetical protein